MSETTQFSVSEAARLCGHKSRNPILKAIKSGLISTSKNDQDQTVIDASELFRVFPMAENPDTGDRQQDSLGDTTKDKSRQDRDSLKGGLRQPETDQETALLAALERENAQLMERIKDKDGVIDDLRHRLDQEGDERRRAQTQLTALLTHQSEKAAPPAPELPRRGWVGLVAALAVVAVMAGGVVWALDHFRFTLTP